MIKLPWSSSPEWANWAANNGLFWVWFERKPVRISAVDSEIWWVTGRRENFSFKQEQEAPTRFSFDEVELSLTKKPS